MNFWSVNFVRISLPDVRSTPPRSSPFLEPGISFLTDSVRPKTACTAVHSSFRNNVNLRTQTMQESISRELNQAEFAMVSSKTES